jgi:hypothetical protein
MTKEDIIFPHQAGAFTRAEILTLLDETIRVQGR